MPVEADSAGWTGGDTERGTITVCGEFGDRKALDAALSLLEGSDFQRADLSVRVAGEAATANPMREDDARNLRTLGTSAAAAGTALAAAGVVIATGGAALPAVAAAAAAGGLTGAAGAALGNAATPDGAARPQQEAAGRGAVLVVSATNAAKQEKAATLLRQAGATQIWQEVSA